MKKIFTSILLMTSLSTFAVPVKCILKESTNNIEEVMHEMDLYRHGPINAFSTELTTGFISSTKGHVTVTVIEKETNMTSNFYGTLDEKHGLGGSVIYNENKWLQVDCTVQ